MTQWPVRRMADRSRRRWSRARASASPTGLPWASPSTSSSESQATTTASAASGRAATAPALASARSTTSPGRSAASNPFSSTPDTMTSGANPAPLTSRRRPAAEAAAERVAPPCPRVADGCGGCDWQHVAPAAQRQLKARIVTDALRRIGRVEPPEPDLGPELPTEGWRTTVRALVDDDGRAGFRLHHAHDPLAVGPAGRLVAHPLVDEVLREGVFPRPVREATVRAGAATGERLVLSR